MKIKKFPDMPADNASFMTAKNIRWFNYVLMQWQPTIDKPLIFLPCGRANKTRTIADPRKFISQGMTHQFLSAITRNTDLEQVILSEPLTIIPYSLEKHPLRPDYNLPPDYLSIQSEFIFIRQVSLVLAKIRFEQPTRDRIYYIGGRHHFFILQYANIMLGSPFTLIYKIPKRGIRDYSSAANEFSETIWNIEVLGIFPNLEPISLDKYLASRGRYTHKAFWKQILILQKDSESILPICEENAAISGFVDLYTEIRS